MKKRLLLIAITCLSLFFTVKASASIARCAGDVWTESCPGLDSFILMFPGGTWTSSDGGVVTVDPVTGEITAIGAGNAIITYTITTSCGTFSFTISITVNPLPDQITGTATVCVGATTTLSDATAGGTWSSSNTGVATIGATTGIITGISPGTAMISYTLSTGCYKTVIVTVNPLPADITGSVPFCRGSTITLSDATAGGGWSSGNTGVATVGNGSGVVFGVSAGTAVITYSLGTGCYKTTIVTVTPTPTISGNDGLCFNGVTTLTVDVAGGTWSSSNTGVATITSGGVVTGVSPGTTIISYVLPTGCFDTKLITVGDTFHIKVCELYPIATCDTVISYCDSLQLSVTGTPGPGHATYTWTAPIPAFPPDINSSGTEAIFTFSAAPTASNFYTVTATYNGCSASDKIWIQVNSTCEPCHFFKPCTASCIGCDTVPYFRTIIASELNEGNITSETKNYFIAKDAILGLSPKPEYVFFMGDGVRLSVVDYKELSNVHFFSSPDCPWEGIEVVNDSPVTGQLVVDSNTLIEDASIAGVFLRNDISNRSYLPPSGDLIYSNDVTYNKNNYDISLWYYKLDADYADPYPFVIENSIFTSRNLCGYHIPSESVQASDCYPFKWPAAHNMKTPMSGETGNNPDFNIDVYPGVVVVNHTAGIDVRGCGYTDTMGDPVNPSYVGQIAIGDPNIADSTNLFDTLNQGLHIISSNVMLYNSIFRRGQLHSTLNSVGVYCTRGDYSDKNQVQLLYGADNTNNRFYNMRYGVYGEHYYNLFSDRCIMKSTNYYLSPLVNSMKGIGGFTFENTSYEQQTIVNSVISNIETGIYIHLEDGYCGNGRIAILNNTITGLTSDTSHERGYEAIKIYDQNLSCNTDVNMGGRAGFGYNNISGYIYGIDVAGDAETATNFSTLEVVINWNTIGIMNNDTSTNPNPRRYGIFCQNLANLQLVAENHVFGDTSCLVNYNRPTPGIFLTPLGEIRGYNGICLNKVASLNNTSNSEINCNYIHDLNIGFEFYDTSMLDWRRNVMMRSKYGMVLTENAVIGQQGTNYCNPKDNVWDENGLGITTGWPGWVDASIFETFTVANDPYPLSIMYIRNDPSGFNGSAAPYYFPTRNGTAGGGVAYKKIGAVSLVACTPSLCAGLHGSFPDTASCAPINGIDGGGAMRPAHEGAGGQDVQHLADLSAQQYTIIPNPSDGNIVIRQSIQTETLSAIRVTNSVGATVFTGNVQFTNGQASLNIDRVARGMYVLEITDTNGSVSKFKVVVEK